VEETYHAQHPLVLSSRCFTQGGSHFHWSLTCGWSFLFTFSGGFIKLSQGTEDGIRENRCGLWITVKSQERRWKNIYR